MQNLHHFLPQSDIYYANSGMFWTFYTLSSNSDDNDSGHNFLTCFPPFVKMIFIDWLCI